MLTPLGAPSPGFESAPRRGADSTWGTGCYVGNINVAKSVPRVKFCIAPIAFSGIRNYHGFASLLWKGELSVAPRLEVVHSDDRV